jgi:uncharacterized protein (TIGR02145 family)
VKQKIVGFLMIMLGFSACMGKILEVEAPGEEGEISSSMDSSSTGEELLSGDAKSSESEIAPVSSEVKISLVGISSAKLVSLSSAVDLPQSQAIEKSSTEMSIQELSSLALSSSDLISSSSDDSNDTVLVDERDGETYNILKVGKQRWMAKNLNFGQFVDDERDPDFIQEGVVKFCYNNDPRNCETDGGLYQWHTAMNLPPQCALTVCEDKIDPDYHQGLCPKGWHIPIEKDWELLAESMGDTLLIGAQLKSNENPEFFSWNRPEFNEGVNSGFAAFPTGFRFFGGGFADRGKDVHFWGTQEAILQNDTLGREVFSRTLSSQNSALHRESYYKVDGFPVRCLKD